MNPGSAEREHLRQRLKSEQARLERRLEREEADLTTHRQRVSERDPCAVFSPAAASEDARQEIRSEQARETTRQLREVEHGLQRLLTDPDHFGRCVRCDAAIAAARLEVLPSTTLCARCAVGAP
ncbi:MAG TPA: TraR/DksA C4-type zinc finger protein [Longimicrobiaceae bacterium]|nr:TraR/DksA C4-type zinc finger protein [Longimicrobiaceae bacterium]